VRQSDFCHLVMFLAPVSGIKTLLYDALFILPMLIALDCAFQSVLLSI
jgi:hypothetical protein